LACPSFLLELEQAKKKVCAGFQMLHDPGELQLLLINEVFDLFSFQSL
jgi:hypothetical protein